MAVIGGFRTHLSITRKTDGNFGNVYAGALFSHINNFVSVDEIYIMTIYIYIYI